MKAGLVARIVGGSIVLGVALALVFVALLATIDTRRSAVDGARRSAEVLTTSFQTQKLVLDVETGTRGYLLTREQRFLAPYEAAARALPAQLERLQRLIRDPGQVVRARGIAAAVTEYLDGWAASVAQSPAPGSDRRATLAEGKELVDGIRARFATFDEVQRRIADREASHADHLAQLALILGGGGVAAALLLVALYAVNAARMIAPVRRVARAAHRVADGDLDVRVREEGSAEVAELGTAFNQMAGALQEGRDELETQNAELEAQQSELQDLLDQVAREKARVERFHHFAQALAGQTDLDPLGDTVLEYLCADADANAGVLYVHDAVAGAYELCATRGVPRDRLAPTTAPDEGIAGRALAERRPVAIAPGDAGLAIAVLGGAQPARHQLSVPLLQGDDPVGVVTLARVEDRPFSDGEVAAALQLADQAAAAVARARLQAQTERSLRTVQAVLDATPDAIALVDLGGDVLVENPPMAALRAELGADDRTRHAFDVPGDDATRQARDELSLEGGRRVLARYAAPLAGERDQAIGRIVVLRDVSAERQAERLKDEFFALVSHELRTPLTSIIGYLELALEEDDDARQRHFLDVIDRNAKRLLRLVGDLLFVAQVEAGTLSLDRRDVDVARLAREAVEAARPRAGREGIELVLDAPDALPAVGDGDRIGQMLDNLIVNALKFTPNGGTVRVLVERHDGRAVLSVTDTGVGIAPSDQGRLFERFFRAPDAAERGVPGAGLGLTIVQAIVRGHGGEITVDSTPGAGTTFRVELPDATDPARVSASAPRVRAGGAPVD